MYLIDTDILVDYLRLHAPAIELLDIRLNNHLIISHFTQFELLQGCRDKADERKISRFLTHFKIIPVTERISRLAFDIFQKHHLIVKMSIPDSFIAATALIHTYILVTRNRKHYQKISMLKVEIPY